MEIWLPAKNASGIMRGAFGSMVRLAIVLLGALSAGGVFHGQLGFGEISTIREFGREIIFSKVHSQDDFIGVRLIWIGGDDTTKIRVISTGRELKAKPGGYFVSKEYGTEGLQLISASAETGEAKLMARWAD